MGDPAFPASVKFTPAKMRIRAAVEKPFAHTPGHDALDSLIKSFLQNTRSGKNPFLAEPRTLLRVREALAPSPTMWA